MMNNPNLVAVQRTDKTGKVVTRHVLAAPKQASARSAMPAPALGAPAPKKTAQPSLKLRPKQLERKHHSFETTKYTADEAIAPESERFAYGFNRYAFFANEVEMYDVLSTTEKFGNAIRMMSMARVRTAEEARQYMRDAGAGDLIIDRSDLMQKLLARNIPADDYMDHYDSIPEKFLDSPHLVDALEFSASSLNKNRNAYTRHGILSGDISYDDIKYIGISALTGHSRLANIQMHLRKLHAGETEYSVFELRELAKRAVAEKLNEPSFAYVAAIFDKNHDTVLNKVKSLDKLGSYYHYYRYSPHSEKYPDKQEERALYATLLAEGVHDDLLRYTEFSDEFFNNDVPVEIAISAVDNGGGITEALAVHEGGIHTRLADGWL